MSEDEAVNILKTMCTDNFCIEQLKAKQAIETILDLYNKEKEKNKELKEMLERRINYTSKLEKDLFENCSNYVVSKDKIREKIEEVKRKREEEWKTAGISMLGSAIDVLIELLEE